MASWGRVSDKNEQKIQVSRGPSTQPFVEMGHPGITTYLSGGLSFDSVRGLRRLLLRLRRLDLARLKNIVGKVAAIKLISQLTREAGRALVSGCRYVLSDVLYADAAAVLKLVLPLLPVIQKTLELIDFERKIE